MLKVSNVARKVGRKFLEDRSVDVPGPAFCFKRPWGLGFRVRSSGFRVQGDGTC